MSDFPETHILLSDSVESCLAHGVDDRGWQLHAKGLVKPDGTIVWIVTEWGKLYRRERMVFYRDWHTPPSSDLEDAAERCVKEGRARWAEDE